MKCHRYICAIGAVILTVLLATSVAIGQPLSSGYYSYMPPNIMGGLEIIPGENGEVLFEIQTIGPSGHLCYVNGKVIENIGYALHTESDPGTPLSEVKFSNTLNDLDEPAKQCSIQFSPIPLGYKVTGSTTCRTRYCGAIAWIDGKYLIPPSICKKNERNRKQDIFLKAYKKKDFHQAYETLSSIQNQCIDFMSKFEIDALRNDLAITQFHLGNKDKCLDILKGTFAANYSTEEELQQNQSPFEFEAYLPIAKATWFNLKKCGMPSTKVNNR